MAQEPDEIRAQLEKTAADLRVLGEQLGAIPPGGAPRTMSLRTARITFAVLSAFALLVAFLIWQHWHSLFAAAAPILWIFVHAWRLQQRARRRASEN